MVGKAREADKRQESRGLVHRILYFILWAMWPVMVLDRWVLDAKQEFRKINLVIMFKRGNKVSLL